MDMGAIQLVSTAELTQLDRLKARLEDWARWRERSKPKLGYSRQVIIKSFGIHDYDYEAQYEVNDNQAMYATDTAIDDLPPAQCAAIQCCYTGVTWRFPRDNYATLLAKAHDALLISLPRRNVVI